LQTSRFDSIQILQEKEYTYVADSFSRQGLESRNIAFSDELDFGASELDFIFEQPKEHQLGKQSFDEA
jgi:hypothetical protein